MRSNDERRGTIEASIQGALAKMSKDDLAGAKAVLTVIAESLEASESEAER